MSGHQAINREEGDTFAELMRPRSTPPVNPHGNNASVYDPSGRVQFNIDTSIATRNTVPRQSIAGDGDHLYSSGLRRIRQGTPHPTPPTSAVYPNGAMSLPGSRMGSISYYPTSPTLNSCEDLSRFPSESLHSFSFAHQSEDFLHTRQNILKRSLEFMRDKFNWSAQSPMITAAQAKVDGDEEVKGVMDLLQRANLVNTESTRMIGPATGPAEIDGNPFEKSFAPNAPDAPMPSPKSAPADLAAKFPNEANIDGTRSEGSSRTATNESSSTTKTSPPPTRRASLKRTYTDTTPLTLQTKLIDAMAQPYAPGDLAALSAAPRLSISGPSVHAHTNRYAPTSQAIFTTEADAPWTILAANDLACLVFGLTQAEIRKIGILDVVKEERREWLQQKLEAPEGTSISNFPYPHSHHGTPSPSIAQYQNGARTASNRRVQTAEAQKLPIGRHSLHHTQRKSRGVLLCGDVVPIQKRNGNTGAASLWVKEKRGGLIWVLEEIMEDLAYLYTSPAKKGRITKWSGDTDSIFGDGSTQEDVDICDLIPELPRTGDGDIDFNTAQYVHQYTSINKGGRIPCHVMPLPAEHGVRVSSFPHIAGIVVLSASTLLITSSNSVFSAALFGYSDPAGLHIAQLIPNFDRLLRYIVKEDKITLVDGMVVPEHSFRKAKAMLSLRDGKEDAAQVFARHNGLPARHRDGGELRIDVQMRVVNSTSTRREEAIIEGSDEDSDEETSEIVYALWITYSRDLHSTSSNAEKHNEAPILKRAVTPPRPTSVQLQKNVLDSPRPDSKSLKTSQQEGATAPTPPSSDDEAKNLRRASTSSSVPAPRRKVISDFYILEDMGQGAYGQVKLARYRRNPQKRVVLKYVTKKRILVDTWTKDRKLGTVPLEIHVLDFLGRGGLKHPNIVEMSDFFEDDVNYYIEMVPHGLPGMDLFDYIELRANMDEEEARNIFVQVARAIHHLHVTALVVHRDIKDENVVLDGDGNIKLIDFGSAAYIRNGPFDVFVGTVDYAAPEVLSGHSYAGKPQDIWALGVLLYTICYKENPFYNVDEILDRELRIPHIISQENLDLIRLMLDRDVDRRPTIEQVLAHPWFDGLPGPKEALALALEKERAFKSR
ncbi:hypothetical protein BGX38DRAFT_1143538 [Terfezia claveryi]|nr:hypothetical protein BGX38DRAFT_1143538 [Terfezia claveryi]